jgi:hypothetical protein
VLVMVPQVRDRLLRQEKDEAGLFRACRTGIVECLPSFSVLPGSEGFLLFRLRTGLSTVNLARQLYRRASLKDQLMKKSLLALALAGGFTCPIVCRAQFADSVISYQPGTGFASGYTNASAALGSPALGSGIDPFDAPYLPNQLVSIGAGGQITLQMDRPILNNPADPYGINFIVFGNQFFIEDTNGAASGLYYHPSSMLVQVSANGSTWYTLNPTLAPQAGQLYPTDGSGNPQVAVNPALTAASFNGQNLAGIEALYAGSAGGTGYDLAWAQDAQSNSVNLASADYVRIEVQSGVLDLDAISVVPEPAAWTLAACGSVLFLLRSRRDGCQ